MKRKATTLGGSDHQLWPSSKRQLRSESAHLSPLLTLPTEVRQLVLKELLICLEPIDFMSHMSRSRHWHPRCNPAADDKPHPSFDDKLHPSILITCRQLKREGTGLLYQNTIKFRTFSDEPCDWFLQFPYVQPPVCSDNPPYGVSALHNIPLVLKERISRIHIDIFSQSTKPADVRYTQSQLRTLTALIKDNPAWTHITIEVNVAIVTGDVPDSFLNPFLYIRGRQSAIVKGISETTAAKLSTLMTSSDPVIDLDKMYSAASSYVFSVNHVSAADMGLISPALGDVIGTVARSGLAAARDDNNVDEFRKQRARLVKLVSASILKQQNAAFADDPSDWDCERLLFMKKFSGRGATNRLSDINRSLWHIFPDFGTNPG